MLALAEKFNPLSDSILQCFCHKNERGWERKEMH
jgi:hypothetical protein